MQVLFTLIPPHFCVKPWEIPANFSEKKAPICWLTSLLSKVQQVACRTKQVRKNRLHTLVYVYKIFGRWCKTRCAWLLWIFLTLPSYERFSFFFNGELQPHFLRETNNTKDFSTAAPFFFHCNFAFLDNRYNPARFFFLAFRFAEFSSAHEFT